MSNNSFIQIPSNLDDPIIRQQFFISLVEQINILLGNITSNPVITYQMYMKDKSNITNEIQDIQKDLPTFIIVDGSKDFTGEVKYDSSVIVSDSLGLINKGYVDSNFTNNPQQDSIDKLNQAKVARGSSYDQDEAQSVADNVKAIADKVDSLINTLANSNIIA